MNYYGFLPNQKSPEQKNTECTVMNIPTIAPWPFINHHGQAVLSPAVGLHTASHAAHGAAFDFW